MAGRYEPSPVRKVEIPKPGGKGMRQLGIPTVVDRFIQQALHQILGPIFDKDFSESSYGFRPVRKAQQAVQQACRYIKEGRRWVNYFALAEVQGVFEQLDGWIRRRFAHESGHA